MMHAHIRCCDFFIRNSQTRCLAHGECALPDGVRSRTWSAGGPTPCDSRT